MTFMSQAITSAGFACLAAFRPILLAREKYGPRQPGTDMTPDRLGIDTIFFCWLAATQS
jgi:hypothetical protein